VLLKVVVIVVLGLNQGLTIARQVLLHLEPLHQPFFAKGFFEIGSHELFALAGFEPPFS
jgi:hypothetical protein